MTDESRYVEAGDEFGDLNEEKRPPRWRVASETANYELFILACQAVGRREGKWGYLFKDHREEGRWLELDEAFSKGTVDQDWFKHVCQWAEKQGAQITGIVTLTLNTEAFRKWGKEHGRDTRIVGQRVNQGRPKIVNVDTRKGHSGGRQGED